MKINCLYDKLVPVKELKFHPDNPNKHTDNQIERLAKILDYQGFRYPIKVSKQSGYITSGHGRLLSAIKNKWAEVPVNFQDYENPDQEYADVVADNAIASWSELDLGMINLAIPDFDPTFNIDLLGIKDFTLDPSEKFHTDEDSVPEPPKEAKTKLGDLYILGNHRLLCGDSTTKADVERLMNGEIAEITFTSHPYNAGKKGYEDGKSKYENDEDCSGEKWLSLMQTFSYYSLIYSKYSFINVQWLYSNKTYFIDWLNSLKNYLIQDFVWCKPTMPSINANCVNSDHEYIFVFKEENKNRKITLNKDFQGSISSWFEQNRASGNKYSDIHRATFNVSLPEKFINDFGAKSVIDFFGGTGSTMIACEKTNAKCFMLELDPIYCDVIITRWEQFTGKTAEKVNPP